LPADPVTTIGDTTRATIADTMLGMIIAMAKHTAAIADRGSYRHFTGEDGRNTRSPPLSFQTIILGL
jgi:hypothetical protein